MPVTLRRVKNITPPPEGWHTGYIESVEEANDITSPYDEPDNPKEKIKLGFHITSSFREDGTAFTFKELYTNSDHPDSKLVKHLLSVGVDLKEVEDLEKALVGTQCRIQVAHRPGKNDSVWPKVLGLAPLEGGNGFEATKEAVPF